MIPAVLFALLLQLPHSVSLSWNPVTTNADGSPLVGQVYFNVFRAPGYGTNYVKINGSPLVCTSYYDAAVSAGATYSYRVKSWTPAAGGSGYSNKVSATVP